MRRPLYDFLPAATARIAELSIPERGIPATSFEDYVFLGFDPDLWDDMHAFLHEKGITRLDETLTHRIVRPATHTGPGRPPSLHPHWERDHERLMRELVGHACYAAGLACANAEKRQASGSIAERRECDYQIERAAKELRTAIRRALGKLSIEGIAERIALVCHPQHVAALGLPLDGKALAAWVAEPEKAENRPDAYQRAVFAIREAGGSGITRSELRALTYTSDTERFDALVARLIDEKIMQPLDKKRPGVGGGPRMVIYVPYGDDPNTNFFALP